MPLPTPKTEWPPRQLAVPHRDITGWSAWWGGDPEILSDFYGGTLNRTKENGFEQSWARRGGLVGALQRFFWGQPTAPGEQRAKLHVPVAAEIAQVSADLLFGAPPQITVEDEGTQKVIDRLLGEAAHTMFHEGAEACAALGHVYFRVAIDRAVDPDGPLVSQVDADMAFPVYRYGRLFEVSFLSEYVDGGDYYRHIEHHTRGLVEHAIYKGDAGNLGIQVPLEYLPETEDLAELVVEVQDGRHGIPTGLDRLDVVGIPNARTRTWRHLPAARYLGRSDISGVEPELDALDDAWSSWMRDLDHGRSRIHVPQNYLRSQGPGKGATFNLDQGLYVGMNAMPSTDGGLEITQTQFKIRTVEHAATCDALLERIVSGAGYSPQTFGVEDTTSLTATESWARQVRTQNTRNAKIRRWRQGLIQLSALVLEVDRLHFGGSGKPDVPIQVEFQETVSESQQARAQTAQLLSAAKAASIQTLVQMQHPDWDEDRVDEEVALIKEEIAVSVPDPLGAFDDLENTPPGDEDQPADEPPAPEGDPEDTP